MVDSHIELPTASLYGQSRPILSSSLGPSFTQGVAGMLEDELTPKRLDMLSINAFSVISSVPDSHSPLEAQPPPCQDSPPRLFVGNFVASVAWKSLHVSSDPAITMSST